MYRHVPGVRRRKRHLKLRIHLQDDVGRLGAEEAKGLLGVGAVCGARGAAGHQDGADGFIQQEVFLHPVDALCIAG